MSTNVNTENRIAIVGISGRMGQELCSLASEFGLNVTEGVSSKAPAHALPALVVTDVQSLRDDNVDVVIDFSLPELTERVAQWCANHRKPLVSGVTGITDDHRSVLAATAKVVPVLWAPNMSLGVAVMAKMLNSLSHLEGFDFQIEELHHTKKKDRPSGTALFLQEKLKEAVGNDVPAPLAIRGGGIFGIHRVWAMGEEEMITIEHTAMNRRVFARGALRAACWIRAQKAGLYRMQDVLG